MDELANIEAGLSHDFVDAFMIQLARDFEEQWDSWKFKEDPDAAVVIDAIQGKWWRVGSVGGVACWRHEKSPDEMEGWWLWYEPAAPMRGWVMSSMLGNTSDSHMKAWSKFNPEVAFPFAVNVPFNHPKICQLVA